MLPKRRLISPHRFGLAHVAVELAYGRGAGVGRGLGDGVNLGVTVAVAVGIGVGVPLPWQKISIEATGTPVLS